MLQKFRTATITTCRIAILLFTLESEPALALDLGVGLSSATDGRETPALYAAVPLRSWVISGTSSGVQNEVYFENNYTASLLYSTKVGDTWLGKPELGFGAGFHYAIRELADSASGGAATESSADTNFGPAFRLLLRPPGPFFFGFDFVLGLGVGVFSGGAADAGAFVAGVRL